MTSTKLLSDSFVQSFRLTKPDFGPVGEITYLRTYSRDGEVWYQTVARVVEGCYSWQRDHCEINKRPFDEDQARHSAEQMYRLMYNMKFLPPGRGLRNMGCDVLKQTGAAANNCGFVSTADDPFDAFCWAMDMLMLGVGVGFDTLGAGTRVGSPDSRVFVHDIADSRSGWVLALRVLLNTYNTGPYNAYSMEFNYSRIRPAGSAIGGFGGIASGPEPLREMLEGVRGILSGCADSGGVLTSAHINDIMALVGRCVVSGGVRRSAEIAFIESSDNEGQKLKNTALYPEETSKYRWAANHSIKCNVGDDYRRILANTAGVSELGVMWLDNARSYSRMGRRRTNLDVRAAGANPCTTKVTPILTQEFGYRCIGTLSGQEVTIWNGFEWSRVTPCVTGYQQKIYTVHLSDGTSLDCTPYHKFNTTAGLVCAKDLTESHKMRKTSMPIVEQGIKLDFDAYTHGFFCGDGQGQGSKQGILLYGGEKQACASRMVGRLSESKLKADRVWLGLSGFGVPSDKGSVPVNAKLDQRLDWLAGLLDSDGTILENPNSQALQITSIHKGFLDRVRLMLTTLGVQAKVALAADAKLKHLPDGHGGVKQYECKAVFRLSINATDTYNLQQIGLSCSRLKLTGGKPQRDARRFVRVQYVERHNDSWIEDEVFCFKERVRGLGTFNGIVTGQCAEQTLEHKELCCLVEVFPSRIKSFYEFQKVLKYAYLYAKTVTTIPVHNETTQEIISRNRRIGCSLTGIQQAIQQKGNTEFYAWCDRGYKYLKQIDERYSEWFHVPRSIKITSVKPSGTVSKLPGVSSGIHFPVSECYFQVIRFASSSPYLIPLQAAGYRCVDLSPNEPNTTAVYFGVIEGGFSRAEAEVSIWEQAEHAAKMQHYWADNQVSITIKYKPDERGELANLLRMYEDRLKSVSFFPIADHGFDHAPWQPATRDEIEAYNSKLLPLNYATATHETEDQFCDGGTCELSV